MKILKVMKFHRSTINISDLVIIQKQTALFKRRKNLNCHVVNVGLYATNCQVSDELTKCKYIG